MRNASVLVVLSASILACEVDVETRPEASSEMARFGVIGGPGNGEPCSVTEQGDFTVGGTFETTGTVTNGCEADEICAVFACNNAIPQTCFGTCTEPSGGFPIGKL